jgi:hypothetical protein
VCCASAARARVRVVSFIYSKVIFLEHQSINKLKKRKGTKNIIINIKSSTLSASELFLPSHNNCKS